MKKPGDTRGPTTSSPSSGSRSPASTRISCVLPEPLGPSSPTRSPKWTSSENGETSSSIPSERRSSTRRAESPPRIRTTIDSSTTGAGGGPASRKRSQRVSAASAFLAQSLEYFARSLNVFISLNRRRSSSRQRLTASPSRRWRSSRARG